MMDIIFLSGLNHTDLDIIECGTQKCDANYSFGPAIRDFYLLHFIHYGCGYFRLGDKEFFLKAGDLFLITPNMLTYYYADSKNPWHYSWVAFHGTKADYYLNQANLLLESPVLSSEYFEYVNQNFKQMMNTKNLNKNKEIEVLGLFYLLLSKLIEQAPETLYDYTTTDVKQAYIDKALEFIKLNYSKKISILQIAKYVGIDSKYLCTLFKTNLKTSPYRILLSIKIDKACELIL